MSDMHTIFDPGKPLTDEEREAQTSDEKEYLDEEELELKFDEQTHEKPKEETKSEIEKLREEKDNLHKALTKYRGESKAEIQALRRQLKAAEEKLNKIEQTDVEDEINKLLEEYDPEDAVTVAGVKKLLELQTAKAQKALQNLELAASSAIANVSQKLFEQTHSDYYETVESYLDKMNDPEFVKQIYSEGPINAPEKLYKYAKAQESPEEKEAKITKKIVEGTKPIRKPKTMGQKSRIQSKVSPKNIAHLDYETKRRLLREGKLSKADIDDAWLSAIDEEG